MRAHERHGQSQCGLLSVDPKNRMTGIQSLLHSHDSSKHKNNSLCENENYITLGELELATQLSLTTPRLMNK